MRPSRLPTGSTPRQISSPAGKELSLPHALLPGEPLQGASHHCGSYAPPRRHLLGAERPVSARPARDQIPERILHRLEQLPRQPRRGRHAQSVAHPRRVLGCNPAFLAGKVERKRTSLLEELLERRLALESLADLRFRQIAQGKQQVMQPVQAVGGAAESLGGVLVLRDRSRVEQLAHLGLAEQLAQLRLVDRERLRAALGERRIAVVDEVRDVAEEQGGGEGRGGARIDGDHAQPPVLNPPQRLLKPGQIEDVAQALAVRLEEQGKASVAGGDLQEIARALSLCPERDRKSTRLNSSH